MTRVQLNTVTRKVEVFSGRRDVQARADIAALQTSKAAQLFTPDHLDAAEININVLRNRPILASMFPGDDDTTKVQKAFNAARDKAEGGTAILDGFRDWVVEDTLDCHPSVPLRISCDQGSRIAVNYTGVTGAVLKGTHPTTPSTRGKPLIFNDLIMVRGPSILSTDILPVYIEQRESSLLGVSGKCTLQHDRFNTVIRTSAMWNARLGGAMEIFGGGVNRVRKECRGVGFSLTTGDVALSADTAGTFAAADEGEYITLNNGGGRNETFLIAKHIDDQNVRVWPPALRTYSAHPGVFEPVKGSMTASGTTLTLESSALTAADVGRFVGVPGAGAGGRVLRGQIVSQTGSACELDTAASTTVSNEYIILSPAVEFFSEGGNNHNDVMMHNWAIVRPAGCPLFIDDAAGFIINDTKIHGVNQIHAANPIKYDEECTSFHAFIDNFRGRIGAIFDGGSSNRHGNVLVRNQKQSRQLLFSSVDGTPTSRVPLVHVAGGNSHGGTVVENHFPTKVGVYTDEDVLGTDGSSRTDVGSFLAHTGPVMRGPSVVRGIMHKATWRALQWMTNDPSWGRTRDYDTLISSLVDAGVWDKLDLLYVLAAADSQAARINLKRPGWATVIPQNSPTFTADQGYTFNGASLGYLDTGLKPTMFERHAQDDAHFGVWVRDAGATLSNLNVGSISGATVLTAWPSNGTTMRGQISSSTVQNFGSNTDGIGHFLYNRTGATASEGFKNGGSVGTSAEASVDLATQINAIIIGRNGASTSSDDQVSFFHLGASLTSGEASDLYDALNTYKTAVGA